jgi:hypothetical protein
MKAKNITFSQCDGNLHHNNKLSSGDIAFIQTPLEQAYQECFEQAVKLYNATQKRKDRHIKDSYFKYTFSCEPTHIVVTSPSKRKSFYEAYVQIGSIQDTPLEDVPTVISCLKEYFEDFIQRNVNLYVFNAVIHTTDNTPHLHIDYIPLGHFKRGVGTQNSLSQALREMGYNQGKDSTNRWRLDERTALENICKRNGLTINEPTTKEDYAQLENKYHQTALALSSTKEELTQVVQILSEQLRTIEVYSLPDGEILNPTGFKEKKKVWSGDTIVQLDKERFINIQQLALATSKITTLNYSTLKVLQSLLESISHLS